MTLDIAKYLENLIKKEAKVSHFALSVKAGTVGKLNTDIKTQIEDQYGESSLLDADYIIFCTKDGPWASGDVKKLFDLVNRALGKDANSMTQSDFKQLKAEDDEGGSSSVFMKISIK